MTRTFFKFLVRFVAALGLLAALAYLFSSAFVPSGRRTVTYDFVRPAPYLSEPKPSERLGEPTVAADGSSRVPLTGAPLFVDFTPPKGFETATVTLEYENAGQPVVEIGALSSSIDGQFAMQPLEHRVIDALPWKRVSSGSLTLYQRHDRYASVDEFFRDPPPRAKLATYRAEAPIPYRLEGYEPSAADREVTVSLRGRARMLTYVKDEPLSFTFSVQDMNRLPGADPVTVSVYQGDGEEAVARTVLPDDGNTGDDQRSSGLRDVPLTLTAPAEGFYQIEFTASDDVFIRSIRTRQSKLTFVDSLYLGDHVGYSDRTDPITVYADGGRLSVRTPHAEAVQTVTVGERRVNVEQPNVRYESVMSGHGLTPVTVPKRNVLLQSVGLFAFSPEEYFSPLPYAMQWYATPSDLDADGIDFVLSSYEPPAANGSVISGRAVFDLRRLAKTETGAYRFVIDTPGIEETRFGLSLARLIVTMQRPPMTVFSALPSVLDAFRPEPERPEEIVIDGRTFGEMPE